MIMKKKVVKQNFMIWIKMYYLVSLAIKNDGEENKTEPQEGTQQSGDHLHERVH